ncbi:hypothetical protein [uncultured Desulfovibrio sp.]|uniref:Uncharacterized protein n=1 Tax=Candidatus Desulfovibrio intestinavium TaxID=2838534 RepID=A0A9D2KQD6_9BACT|nr:hypothetical protein [uncultured Desulfovibrio sp.]HJA78434.1 hypothetical protein [Candidatus Desulfovibrio intestinavium]
MALQTAHLSSPPHRIHAVQHAGCTADFFADILKNVKIYFSGSCRALSAKPTLVSPFDLIISNTSSFVKGNCRIIALRLSSPISSSQQYNAHSILASQEFLLPWVFRKRWHK